MDVAITRMSSKGQVVIPAEMRGDIEVGDKILVIRNEDQIIMKKASKLDRKLEEDMEFARRTEAAYKRIEAGKGISMKYDDFIKELKKW